MSEKNVEAFKRAVAARNRGDIEAFLEEIDTGVELHPGMAAQLQGRGTVYRGHDGVREWLRDLDEAFVELPAEFPEIRDLGTRVIAIGSVRGRGMESGAPIEWPLAYIVDFRNGKMALIRTYLDHDDALEAARASE